MNGAPPRDDETARLAALQRCQILDTPSEEAFDDLTGLAAQICAAPIALVSLVDATRLWFKARVGVEATEVSRDVTFCAQAIHQSDLFIVQDVTQDPRFADSPQVISDPYVRFYAGVPLVTSEGYALGTLCVMDRVPRSLTPAQEEGLRRLGRQTLQLLERCLYDRAPHEMEAALREREAWLQDFLENASDLIQSATFDGRLLLTNRAWRKTLEYREEEIPHLRLWDVIHPDSRPHCEQILQRLSQCSDPILLETTFVTKSGRAVYVSGSVNCRKEGGQPVSTRAIFRDITEAKRVEAELKASEARYRALFESSQDAIMTLAPPVWKFTSGNPATVRMFRATTEVEFVSLGPWELSPERQPDGRPSADKAREMIALAMEKGSHRFEWTHQRLTGETFPATVLLTRLQLGERLQLQATVRDITEEKQAEQALRESEAKYKQLVESANDIIYRADATGHFTFISPSVERFMGYPEEDLLGQRFTVLVQPDHRKRVERFYDRQFLRQVPDTYLEFPVVRRDGDERWVGQQVHMVEAGGQVVGFHAIVRDITDRKRVEASLEERRRLAELSTELHAALLTDHPLPHALQDCAAIFLRQLDAAMVRMWMLGPGDLCTSCYKAAHCLDRTQCLHLVASEGLSSNLNGEYRRVPLGALKIGRIALGGGPMHTNNVLEDERLANKAWMREHGLQAFAGYPLVAGPHLLGVVAVFSCHPFNDAALTAVETASKTISLGLERKRAQEDLRCANDELERRVQARTAELTSANAALQDQIAQREQLEQQLRQSQKMEAIGRLAGGVAHDFNNLLTIMKGYSELTLAKMDLRNDVRQNVEQIKKATDRATGLTQQLLSFSRSQEVETKVVDVNDLVSGIASLLRRLVGEHIGLSVSLAVQPCYANLDAIGFEQVLINLAANARDAMPEGGELTIWTAIGGVAKAGEKQKSSSHEETVLVTVTDTGIGMDAATQARIFEPFYTTKPVGKGTGLGLATAYRMVEKSGGTISVASEPGAGTTFTLAFPRVAAPETRCAVPVARGDSRGSETILLVEDEPQVRALTKAVLNGAGYTVLEAGNGKEGLAMAQAYSGVIHLLLTDGIMPEMNGWDLARRLSALRPDLRVLFLTGYVDTAIPEYVKLEQQGRILHKPTPNDVLTRTIREILDRPSTTIVADERLSHLAWRILVVDDDAQIRAMIEDLLKDEPLEVRTCATAREARQCLEDYPADVLLVDMLMPDINDIETIQAVQRKWPGLIVIAMSGGGAINAEVYLAMARRVGASNMLRKPFSKRDLLQAIEAVGAARLP